MIELLVVVTESLLAILILVSFVLNTLLNTLSKGLVLLVVFLYKKTKSALLPLFTEKANPSRHYQFIKENRS